MPRPTDTLYYPGENEDDRPCTHQLMKIFKRYNLTENEQLSAILHVLDNYFTEEAGEIASFTEAHAKEISRRTHSPS